MRICDWSSDVCSSDLAFEPRGVGARAEDGDVDLAQSIGEPRDERGFGADDDEIDRVRLYEGEQAIEIVGGDRDAFGKRLDPWIARCGIELGAAWRLCQLPAEGLFAAPRSAKHDSHLGPFSRSAVHPFTPSPAFSLGGPRPHYS